MKNKSNLESQIQLIITNTMLVDFNDDFYKNITITSVILQSGNSEALVYFRSIKNKEKSIEKMQQVSSKLSKKVASGLNIFKAPKLIFIYDDQLEQINKIESLLDSVKDDVEKE